MSLFHQPLQDSTHRAKRGWRQGSWNLGHCLEKPWMQLSQSHNVGEGLTTHLVSDCQPSVKWIGCWLENASYQEKNKGLWIGKRVVRSEKAIKEGKVNDGKFMKITLTFYQTFCQSAIILKEPFGCKILLSKKRQLWTKLLKSWERLLRKQ